jgi:hypothetical protein
MQSNSNLRLFSGFLVFSRQGETLVLPTCCPQRVLTTAARIIVETGPNNGWGEASNGKGHSLK